MLGELAFIARTGLRQMKRNESGWKKTHIALQDS
jgi:hypothetical protein